MREILFRAKRLDNGKWVTSSCLARAESESGETTWYIGAGNPALIGFDENGNILESVTQRDCTHYKVDPATVGQYTGLTDKNGKRIFEGDTIECWSEGVKARGTVLQNRGGLWIIYPAWQKRIMWGLCSNENGSTNVEIIGNIHDNPELVEGGEG